MKTLFNIENISSIERHEEGSLEHILLNDTLDSIRFEEREKLLDFVLSKLQFRGIIEITGVDVYLIANHILSQSLDIKTINDILSKQSYGDINTLCDKLKKDGLKIEYKTCTSYTYKVIAKKNG